MSDILIDMLYNIHPIFVHFPIALLALYSVIKILPLRSWFPLVAWRDIERALLVFGTLGAFAALYTGEIAEHLVRPNHQLVEAHSTFATLSTWLYSALLVGELALVASTIQNFMNRAGGKFSSIIIFLKKFLAEGVFPKVLAFVALVSISITGLLGGVIVYGVSADPVAPFILNILGISL